MIMKNYHLLVTLLFMILGIASSRKVEVDTECGPVEGKRYFERTDAGKNKKIFEFRNIPYAVPPIGPLRWRPPVRLNEDPSKCWEETLEYNKNKIIACKQHNPREPDLVSSEDCLVLTIRTPSIRKNAKLPVLFWIHGGGLVYGHSEMKTYFPNRQFTASMEAVTVSINYRLNAFGFLSLQELWINSGPDESYGNYGLMDQILALKWVRDNIQNFGGDPNKVTIFGESGGATAVYGLIASPLAKGLFSKASALSGAPNYRVTHTLADQIFRPLLAQTPCSALPTNEQIVGCLQSLPAEVFLAVTDTSTDQTSSPILSYHWQFPTNTPYQGLPLEIVDPIVVPYSPGEMPITPGDSLDILIGNSAQEIGPLPGAPPFIDRDITDFESLENEIKPKLDTFKSDVYSSMLSLYTQNCDSSISLPRRVTAQYIYTLMTTDALVTCTTGAVARYLSQFTNYSVYRYVISQPDSKRLGLGINSAFHGWGTHLLFGLRILQGTPPPRADRKLMLNIRQIYRRFIHSDPWLRYTYKNRVIEFWKRSILSRCGYHEQQCKAWEDAGVLNHSWGNLGQ